MSNTKINKYLLKKVNITNATNYKIVLRLQLILKGCAKVPTICKRLCVSFLTLYGDGAI